MATLRLLSVLLIAGLSGCAVDSQPTQPSETSTLKKHPSCNEQEGINLAMATGQALHARGLLPENSKYADARTEPELLFRDASDALFDHDPNRACQILHNLIEKYELQLS